jgi:hypothetical protein
MPRAGAGASPNAFLPLVAGTLPSSTQGAFGLYFGASCYTFYVTVYAIDGQHSATKTVKSKTT